MKIDQSTLSMDAYSGHRDVGAKTESNLPEIKGIANGREPFLLNLGEEGNVVEPEGNLIGSDKGPITTKGESGTNPDENEPSKLILHRAIGGLLQSDLAITGFTKRGTPLQQLLSQQPNVRRNPFSMLFNTTQVYQKTESFNFASTGSIQTADGRNIDFNLDLSLTRQETTYSFRSGSLPVFLDPLVLSFDDGLSTLSGASFSFDLTGDGLQNTIGSLSQGSGFLSLDLNDDGIINDGLELFGPHTGHGFNELATYDIDGNKWIDENDPIFEQLSIWMGAGGEEERLISLQEAGVGAISLSNLTTHFDLKDSGGKILGTVARAGIFIMENGEPRSLQELELNLDTSAALTKFVDTGEKESIDQALAALQQIVNNQRRQLQFMTQRWDLLDQKRDSLAAKFWQWQENNWIG